MLCVKNTEFVHLNNQALGLALLCPSDPAMFLSKNVLDHSQWENINGIKRCTQATWFFRMWPIIELAVIFENLDSDWSYVQLPVDVK